MESTSPASNPYAQYLHGRAPFTILAETPSALEQLIAPLDGEQLNIAPAPGKWSVRELLAHLADVEIALGWRLRQALAEPGHTLQPFDQDKWARNYAGYTAEAGLRTFLTLRAWNLALLTTVDNAAYAHPVNHPEHGPWTLCTLVEFLAGHDTNHLERLPAMVQSILTLQ